MKKILIPFIEYYCSVPFSIVNRDRARNMKNCDGGQFVNKLQIRLVSDNGLDFMIKLVRKR